MDILFDVYDSTGGVAVDSETVIPFDQERKLKNGTTLSSGEITVSPVNFCIRPPDSYTLLLIGKVTLDVSSGNSRTQSKAWIEVDEGSGFYVVPGTDGYMYNRTTDSGFGSTTINTTYSVKKSAGLTMKFRIRAQKLVGTNDLVTLAGASNFIGMVDL